jgi:hypothetical protein
MAHSTIMQKIEDHSEERSFWLVKGPTTRAQWTTGGSRT